MENEIKTALFVGGNADGYTKEISEAELRLSWQGSSYLLRGTLETKAFSTFQIYVLESMSSEEERSRLDIIKKAL